MEAKDLRIGNYLELLGEIRKVEGIFNLPKRKEMYWIKCEGIIDTKIIHCEPIPLTEEWLLKFGFEWEDVESKTNGETDKMLFKDILLMKRHHNDLWAACPYGYLISPHRTLYVHQLQNLYFALTGEELTIKE